MAYKPKVLVVAEGGTGDATLTSHGVLIGAGTGNVAATVAGSAGQILQSGGSSADPAYSTSTYPTTNAVSTLLYASGTNVMAALPTANSAILATNSSGVPSITTASGNWLNTSRCAFSASLSANTSNDKTGDGTIYTTICNTVLFDQGSNYNNSTGTFTAPVAGKYYLTGTVSTNNQNVINDSIVDINCSTAGTFRGSRVLAGEASLTYVISVFAVLASSETVTLRFAAYGGAKTVGLAGNSGGPLTYFSGFLVC